MSLNHDTCRCPDANDRPMKQHVQPQHINATKGCPCDPCPDNPGCQMECVKFKAWCNGKKVK